MTVLPFKGKVFTLEEEEEEGGLRIFPLGKPEFTFSFRTLQALLHG